MKSVAIGIYADGDWERIGRTLSAIRTYTPETHRLLLLLDGIAQIDSMPQMSDLRQSHTSAPRGTAACFNRLIASESADLYVLLESGAEVGPHWLERLISALNAHPQNGLAGPSTNLCWNDQAIFPGAIGTSDDIARCAREAFQKFGNTTRTLEPLYSLADFCYAVRHEVVELIGPADERYGLGPCWEMDYNIRAARAGWRGVWVRGAFVYRPPIAPRRHHNEARFFAASKVLYQDKFCGARLRGGKQTYREHCRGDACPNFAPSALIPGASGRPAPVEQLGNAPPLVSCIMPTCDRLEFVPEAFQCFFAQDYPNLELIVVDDGVASIESLIPQDPRVRCIRLREKKCVGAKRNIACAAARGEIIVHFDDDDWYPPHRVSAQVRSFTSDSIVISGTSSVYYEEPDKARAWMYRFRGSRNWVAGNTLAYRKSWWAAHPFAEIQIGEDSRFIWAAPSEAVADLRLPELCVARIHARNTSPKSANNEFWEPIALSELARRIGTSRAGQLIPAGGRMVSCIMPTFNRRAFVALSIQAFLTQDYPHKELIIVDDGSDSVADLTGLTPNIQYIRLEQRRSIGEKRNLACERAQGAIIAHWDDDDWYGPERLSRQVQPLLEGSAELTGLENEFQLDLSAGRFWRPRPHLHRQLFVGDVHGGTLVYWKRLFEEGCRFPNINLAEDAMFIRCVTERGKRLARVSNTGFFIYMRHGRNSWQFESGKYLDPSGWETTERPGGFREDLLASYQFAASALSQYS